MTSQVPININVTKQGEVAILTMSGTQNRVNIIFCKKWMKALDQVESWPDVKALVTTGSGKFYSNGLDLDFLLSASSEEKNEFEERCRGLRKRLITFPILTIAAINGHCFAAGLLHAFYHDYRVMQSTKGWMCLNEVDIGLRFSESTRALFAIKFTPKMIRDVALLENRFTAQDAFRIGLADKVADEGKSVLVAVEMANSLIKGRTYSRRILHDMKQDVYGLIHQPSDSHSATTSVGKILKPRM